MSILQVLREKADWLIVAFVGGAILLFVVDFEGCTGTRQRRLMSEQNEIGIIGKESLSAIEFEQRVRNLTEIYRLSGTQTISEELDQNIREQVWEQIVREKVLGKEFDKLGIQVSDDELHSLVFGLEKHPIVEQLFANPETGVVDEQYMNAFLSEMEFDPMVRNYWLFFEKEIITDRINSKYNNLVSKGMYVTSLQADFERNNAARQVDFYYTGQFFRTIPDTAVTVTSDEIRRHYNQNKESFHREARRSFEYIAFDLYPTEEDFAETLREVESIAEEFRTVTEPASFINISSDSRYMPFYFTADQLPEDIRDFALSAEKGEVKGPWQEEDMYVIAKLIDSQVRPDSVRARHILITPDEQRSLPMARTEADSLYDQIREGADFGALAMAFSGDPGSTQTGGDLGWFTEGTMVGPFNDACFTGKTGDLMKVETDFGIHIIEILNQSTGVQKYNVGIIERRVLPSNKTIQDLRSEANRFANSYDTYDKFVLGTAEEGLSRRIASDVQPGQREIEGISTPRPIVSSLFQTKEKSIILTGYEQPVFELEDQFIVAFCTEVQEEGIASLRDVEEEIEMKLIDIKKADMIAERLRNRLSEGGTLRGIAGDMGLTVETATDITFRSFTVPGVAGIEPSLIAAAVASPEGEISGPVKGDNGVFLLEVFSAEEMQPDGQEMTRDRIASMNQVRAFYQVFEALKEQIGVEDRRYRLF